MISLAVKQGSTWSGVAVSDLIFTDAVYPHFQESEEQVIVCRAGQVPNLPESKRVICQPKHKDNPLSMDALFLRGQATQIFLEDFPDVALAEYWDDAAVAWCRRHKDLGIKILSEFETLHRVHDPKWANSVTWIGNMAVDLRIVGEYNRSRIVDFKQRRKSW